MARFFQNIGARLGVIGLLFVYLWKRKLWWLIPMMSVFMVFGVLIMIAQATPLGPFIYALF